MPSHAAVEQKGAILEDAVVIDPHRDEDEVPGPVRIETPDHVVEEPEPRGSERAVPREPAFRIHGLRNAVRGRHRDVAFENTPVERVVRVPTHEIRAGGTHEALHRPDARPLSDRVAQSRPLRREIRKKDVVHVAAVVHHEDHRRTVGNGREAGVVRRADANAIQRSRESARRRVARPEVDPGVEGGDDLRRVARDAFLDVFARRARLAREGLGGFEDPRIEAKLVHEDLALRELEGGNAKRQARVQLVDDPVRPAAQHGADRRLEKPIEHRPSRKGGEQDESPGREGDRGVHGSGSAAIVSDGPSRGLIGP